MATPRPNVRRLVGALALALVALASAGSAMASPTAPIDPDPTLLARPPGTPLYNWFADSFPILLIVAGGIVVVVVLMARAKAARAPKLPTLEERFARLAQRNQDEAAGDSAPPPRAPATRPSPGSSATSPAPARATGSQRADALDTVVRDAEELAERLAAAMDARADRLEALIRQADDRLRRLEAARAGTPTARPLDDALVEPRWGEPARQAASPARSLTPSFDADAQDPIHRQVFDLADQGLGSLEIARRLGQPTGQVELILALRGR